MTPLRRFNVMLLAFFVVLSVPQSFSQTAGYTVVPLGPALDSPSGLVSPTPRDINKQGWVVGSNRPIGGQNSGFLWKGGIVYPMPTLGGTCSSATGINDQGDMVGTVCLPGDTVRHAALWRGGSFVVDKDIFGGTFSSANYINNKGHVIGVYGVADGSTHLYYRTFNTWQDVGANLFPDGLNDSGEIAGQFDVGPVDPVTFQAPTHGFYWYKGKFRDFGSLFGTDYNYAIAIDAAGRIAGTTDLAGDVVAHGMIWDHGFIADLPPLPDNQVSWAMGMNNKVQVVGHSGLKDPFPEDGPPAFTMLCPCTPVLWTDGMVLDLNSLIPSEWVLDFAFGINDSGQIIARAHKNGGPRQSVKLVPKPVSASTSAQFVGPINRRSKSAGVGGPSRLVRGKDGEIREVQ